MSCSYAEGLSKYENKGKLGLPEKFDSVEEIKAKAKVLAQWLKESKHSVFHTGAGISTSAGIPDFRGPKGVWTLEKQGLKPDINISWDDARPTLTHMSLVSLERHGYLQYVVTQNIDGLHLRSGLQRQKLAELHGDMFVDKCNFCHRQFVRGSAATTVGQKSEGKTCPGRRANGRKCRGRLHDNILDWEDGLPDADLDLAISHACAADLSICLGTTLQIVPSGNIPLDTKKRGGRLVICNLQPTKQDRHADMIINTYVDEVMKQVLELLCVPLLQYNPEDDPMMLTQLMIKNLTSESENEAKHQTFEPIEWTIPEEWIKDKDLAQKVKEKNLIKTSIKRQKKNEENTKCDNKMDENNKKQKVNEKCTSEGKIEKQVVDDKMLNNEVKDEIKNVLPLMTEKHIISGAECNNEGRDELLDTKNEVPLITKKYESTLEKGCDSKIKDDAENVQNGNTDCDYKYSTNVLDLLKKEVESRILPVKSSGQETFNELG
ncbi:hypothetical protein Pcinc_022749 [Petrolisthes cinctipes]|uniref:protein acetyllysine N-acetyltransferase n=1 Tax=Petrolisthes cinctipes TaxID=88211 RepID=A0AAE1FE51_PETCI|nr:hypothetical protein Pcinc_022749 [Petrolisthes cinctipes]